MAADHITLQQIRELIELHEQGVSHADLAEAYGLSEDAVDLLAHGSRSRQHRRRHSNGLPGPAASRPRSRSACLGCFPVSAERAALALADFSVARRTRAGPW